MIRRLLFLGALVGAAWWLLGRRGRGPAIGVVVGYEDGSSLSLQPGSLELERLLTIARGAGRA